MKAIKRFTIIAALVATMVPSFAMRAPEKSAQASEIVTTATGYKKASDVDYAKVGSYVVNWGARGEDCSFLSTYAEKFYTGSYAYESMATKKGGTSQSNAPQSALYSSLKSMMKAKHTHETSYGETRDQYRYTDCVRNDYSAISSFYSGRELSGTWDSGKTWNREHVWPDSKGLGGKDEDDIMMLRPTWVNENSSRGNDAYGESGGDFYDPGESVRGDCARITLYVYVRWGNTSKMWGESGVMESLDILLKWMAEDPVDTWEMGRNDAVQSITGTRNVFVDYPEYAWQLFGKTAPKTLVTPSGMAQNGVLPPPVDSADSSVPDSSVNSGESSDECVHAYGRWFVVKSATETEEGLRERFCEHCGKKDSQVIPKTSSGCGAKIVTPWAGVCLLTLCACVYTRKRKEN